MKRTTLIFIALLTINSAWSQNTNLESNTALKLYNLSYFEESTIGTSSNLLPFNYEYTTINSAIINPTLAFQWKTQKNNLQEIELTSVRIGKTGSKQEAIDKSNYNSTVISGSDISSSIISARYERIATFNKKKETKFVPSLGFGVNPFYKREKNTPKISSSYGKTETKIGVNLFVTPRMLYFLSPKFFIDINIPICVVNSYYQIENTENPAAITIRRFNYNQLPNMYSGRIGVGMKL